MNSLGPVVSRAKSEHEGIRTIRRVHTNGYSVTVLRWEFGRWKTLSHKEVRQPRPSDKSF